MELLSKKNSEEGKRKRKGYIGGKYSHTKMKHFNKIPSKLENKFKSIQK